jgi:cystathionine beta-lyase/cystathionine gamma-synthase
MTVNDDTPYALQTLCIHAGQEPNPITGAVMPDISLSTTYAQDGPGNHKGFVYSRSNNPTRQTLEKCLAELEYGKHGIAYSSGCAATTAILMLLESGDRVICGDDVYGGTFRIFDKVLKQFKLQYELLDLTDLSKVEKAITANTKMLWLETPSNPMMKIFDIEGLAAISKKHNLICVVDNTFATPILQSPLKLGADITVHSATKYLNGHSDAVLGIAATNCDVIAEKLHFIQKSTGASPSPFDCYLVLRGLKTLGVRMRQHEESGRVVGNWLNKHPDVVKLYWPGIPTHAGHELAKKQMRGFGGMISFEIKGGLSAAEKFLKALRIFVCAESLGGVESLAEHPAIMTHASIPADQRLALGIADGFIRISIGIEDTQDLIHDLERGFAAARGEPEPKRQKTH